MELPPSAQLPERAFAQHHVDVMRRRERIFGREPRAERAQPKIQPRHHPPGVGFQDIRGLAPVETARVGGDVVDQREHLRGGVFDQSGALDDGHWLCDSLEATCRG